VSHTYATIDEFKAYLSDISYGTTSDASLLTLLEAASRRVDAFTGRSRFGSGFGPRIGTNRYDGNGWSELLELDDDLLSVTSATWADTTGGGTSTLTPGTDIYLVPYDTTPYRQAELTLLTNASFGVGLQTVSISGTWGYQSLGRAAGTAGTASSSATTLLVTSAVQAGMTISVGTATEQMYVRAMSGSTATIDRAVNGTTGGSVAGGTVVYYLYPPEVKDATIRVAQRRWKMRDAGLTGDFGGGAVPVTDNRDSERSILWSTIGHLRVLPIA